MDRSNETTVIREPKHYPTQVNSLAKGHVLQDRYVIEKELGAGGFGITYLAKHRYLDDMAVAIKEYLPNGTAVRDSGMHVHVLSRRYSKLYSWGLHRFLDEARLLRQFKHPNIVTVLDFFEANNTAYLVMNYIQGRSLQAELDGGRVFDEAKLRSIVYPLLDALQLIHSEGLFHRDISPDNILLLEEDDTPILIDFGSARYAMRMHGAQQLSAGEGHTPTAIFKQGFSPIEQYEGTDQGAYTDIYALGATLYRTAFGTRPVDALKRSSELRHRKIDPLESATVKGKGKFSEAFLKAIESALQLEAADRPQTIESWLTVFGKPALAAQGPPAPLRSKYFWQNPKSMLAVVMLVTAAVGTLTFLAVKYPRLTLESVPALLSEAALELSKAPFADRGPTKARRLYLQALALDQDNARAQSGYNATNLLKQFLDAIAEGDLSNAENLLDKAEKELQKAGVGTDVLIPGRQRLQSLNIIRLLRTAVGRHPLSLNARPDIALLLDDLGNIPGGKLLAEAGKRGLLALKEVTRAVQKNDFTSAQSHIADAEHHLSVLGITKLSVARAHVQSKQQEWEATRRAKIDTLMATAERHLNSAPMTKQQLRNALKTYEEVLTLDPNATKAGAGRSISEGLIEVLNKTESNDFSSAEEIFTSVQSVSKKANLGYRAIKDTQMRLAAARKAWSISQARSSARMLIRKGVDQLLAAPFQKEALSEAGLPFRKAQALSGEMIELKVENRMVSTGSELITMLQSAKHKIDNSDFKGATAVIKSKKIQTLSDRIGLGQTFHAKTAHAIMLAEIEWNFAQAKARLSEAPLDKTAQEQAQLHLDRVHALDAKNSQATKALTAIKSLSSVVSALQHHDFDDATTYLKEAQQALTPLGVPASTFESISTSILTAQTTWTRQQHEDEIASKLTNAFDILQRRPLGSTSWEEAESLFQEVSSIDGGVEQAKSGRRMLAALQAAETAKERGDFEDARAQISVAEKILRTFGGGNLDLARKLVNAANRKWEVRKQQQIIDALASAEQKLDAMTLSMEVLQQTRLAYQKVLDLDSNQRQAKAGLSVIASLEAFLQSLQANEFDSAQEHLTQADSTARSARLNPRLLKGASRHLSDVRDTWHADRASQRLLALQQHVSALLAQDGISDKRLALAEKDLREATVLVQSHKALDSNTTQITSALEAVILLYALKGELEEAQFDAARKTLSDIRQQVSGAELDPAIVRNARNVATSAEIDWRLEEASRSLTLGLFTSNAGLDTAKENYAAVKELAPDRIELESALKGISTLRQVVDSHSKRDYHEATALLNRAANELSGVGIATDVFESARKQIVGKQQFWNDLSLERNLNTWTAEAVSEMNRAPFADATWTTVKSLTEKIMAGRPNDKKGLAVQQALLGLQQAKGAIDAEQFSQARLDIEKAQSELLEIGIHHPLENAFRILNAALSDAIKAQLEFAGKALEKNQPSEVSLANAKSSLEHILTMLPNHPIANACISVIDLIQKADVATAATEFVKAANLLADADSELRSLETDETPVPQLIGVQQNAKRQLAKQRPSPGEIYPIVSAALRTITSDPLSAGALDTADKLMLSILAMQADEPTAIIGLQVINHLRIASDALAKGSHGDARMAVTQAEKLLVSMGLTTTVLKSAWQALNVTTE